MISDPPSLRFQLVETMLCHDGIAFKRLHLDRMSASAAHFGQPFDRASTEALIASYIETLPPAARFQLRLELAADGSVFVRVSRFIQPKRHGRVRMAHHFTPADDVLRRHQTTCREMYDRLLPEARRDGFDDFIFSNDRGELTEGAVHNVFIKRGKKLLTPPLDCGVLPGIYRHHVLETNPCAEEQILRPHDLQNAEAIYLTNALVGIYPVKIMSTGNERKRSESPLYAGAKSSQGEASV